MINKIIQEKLSHIPDKALLLTILFGIENNCPHSLFINCKEEFKILKELFLIDTFEGQTILTHPFFEADAPKKQIKGITKNINITKSVTVESWIDSWRDLFPTQGSSGLSYSPKGDKFECIKRMKIFTMDYSFTKDEIFEATEYYIKEQKQRGWNFTKKAHKFIKDTNGSVLSEYCELMKDKPKNSINTFINEA